MKVRFKALAAAAVAALVAAVGLTISAQPAQAASLQQISGFGTNPTNLGFYLYVPNNVKANPAILVAVHYCTGTGPAFYSGSQFASLADQYGFIVIYPSATRSGGCFDVSSPGALRHDGNSDPVGINSMVNYTVSHYNGDRGRIYVTGASSGAMMTNVLLGDYPDVFKAGAAFMGVPFGCFATTDGSSWNSQCSSGQRIMTAQQWGDLVRNAYPGYSGARPRMQLWHGTQDTTLSYPNFNEEIKQWTNVLGVSATPVRTDTPQSGWTRTRYGNSSDQAPVEAISIANTGHNLPLNGQAAMAIHFFGLDGSGPVTSAPVTTRGPVTSAPVTTRGPVTSGPVTSAPVTTGGPVTSAPVTTGGGVPGTCRVTYTVSAWNTGLTANITVTSTTAVNGWSLAFTLPSGQTVTQAWSATISPTSGAVTATNVSYNASIPANGSQSFGFNANHTGNAGKPTSATLNGAACTVA
jgi:poly(hydroxyalkanoate) depolymerase family esterase